MISFMQMFNDPNRQTCSWFCSLGIWEKMDAMDAVTMGNEIENPESKEGDFQIKIQSVSVNACMFRSSWSRDVVSLLVKRCSKSIVNTFVLFILLW